MGSTNHGTQSITFQYFLEATGAKFGKRLLDVLPPGIYSGGYLTRVSDSEVTLSVLAAEIRDADNQVNVRTAVAATLNSTTLNSGAISSATPYLVMRWAYALSSVNYVDIHAIASAGAALQNDIVIGKCVFVGSTLTGFEYTERTFLNIQNLFLKVETSTGLYVQLRAGRIHTATGKVIVPEQRIGPFTVPVGGNSRIDLVYVDENGAVQVAQGTAAIVPTAPAYNGRLVLAEILLVNGDTSISYSRITDVRTYAKAGGGSSSNYNSGWFAASPGGTYDLTHNLGTTNALFQIQFSQSADGSNPAVIGWFYDHSHGDFSWAIGAQVTLITNTTCRVKAAANYAGYIVGVGSAWGTSGYVTSGYYRIIGTSLS